MTVLASCLTCDLSASQPRVEHFCTALESGIYNRHYSLNKCVTNTVQSKRHRKECITDITGNHKTNRKTHNQKNHSHSYI